MSKIQICKHNGLGDDGVNYKRMDRRTGGRYHIIQALIFAERFKGNG